VKYLASLEVKQRLCRREALRFQRNVKFLVSLQVKRTAFRVPLIVPQAHFTPAGRFTAAGNFTFRGSGTLRSERLC